MEPSFLHTFAHKWTYFSGYNLEYLCLELEMSSPSEHLDIKNEKYDDVQCLMLKFCI